MTRATLALAACLVFGCSWAWTQLSGGSGARCSDAQVPFRELAAEASLRLRVTLIREDERQELTLHLQKDPDRLVVVGINAFGAKQFEVVRSSRGSETTFAFGGLRLHPEELVSTAERHYLGPRDPSEPVRLDLCGYDATFRRLDSSR